MVIRVAADAFDATDVLIVVSGPALIGRVKFSSVRKFDMECLCTLWRQYYCPGGLSVLTTSDNASKTAGQEVRVQVVLKEPNSTKQVPLQN